MDLKPGDTKKLFAGMPKHLRDLWASAEKERRAKERREFQRRQEQNNQ